MNRVPKASVKLGTEALVIFDLKALLNLVINVLDNFVPKAFSQSRLQMALINLVFKAMVNLVPKALANFVPRKALVPKKASVKLVPKKASVKLVPKKTSVNLVSKA